MFKVGLVWLKQGMSAANNVADAYWCLCDRLRGVLSHPLNFFADLVPGDTVIGTISPCY